MTTLCVSVSFMEALRFSGKEMEYSVDSGLKGIVHMPLASTVNKRGFVACIAVVQGTVCQRV